MYNIINYSLKYIPITDYQTHQKAKQKRKSRSLTIKKSINASPKKIIKKSIKSQKTSTKIKETKSITIPLIQDKRKEETKSITFSSNQPRTYKKAPL